MNFTELEEYSENHTSPESDVLKKLNRETHAKVLRPRMLSGHIQGKLLEMISCMIKPENILEIGTYTGYSAICLSTGLKKTGELHTIEINPEMEDMITKYIHEAKLENKIKLHIGDALKIIPELDIMFDLVFIDGDKEQYLEYYNLVLDKIKTGGFVIADNVLWSGKVVTTPHQNDREAKAIIEFNDFVQNDKRVENLLINLRDGLMLIRKK